MLLKKIVAIILMAGFIILQPMFMKTSVAREKFSILIKNGHEIITSYYYEENGMLYYYKYGTYVGIRKSSVISVTPVRDKSGGEAVQLDSKFKEKQSEYEFRKKKEAYDNMSECEKRKRMAEKNIRIYCGAPKVPDGLPTGTEGIKQKTLSFKANTTCNYYRDILEECLKKCP